jgi:hypothetical protein
MLTQDDVLASLRDADDHLAASIGVWLFYVQHQFEHTHWARQGEWDLTEALAWMSDDEAAFDAGEVTLTGTVGRLIEF